MYIKEVQIDPVNFERKKERKKERKEKYTLLPFKTRNPNDVAQLEIIKGVMRPQTTIIVSFLLLFLSIVLSTKRLSNPIKQIEEDVLCKSLRKLIEINLCSLDMLQASLII